MEKNAEKFLTLFPNEIDPNDQRLGVELVKVMMEAPMVNPKKKSNPKQMDGKVSTNPIDGTVIEFKKTRKKTTKTKKNANKSIN